MNVGFELNGEEVSVESEPAEPLRDLLRESLDRREVKSGCLSGRCGVCTVQLDGEAVKSCLVMAHKVDGRAVTTVSGLADDGDLHDVQEAFVDHFAAQCGYCTPGFIMAVDALLAESATPSRSEIRSELKGNLCRCTGYQKILDAVDSLAADAGSG